MEHTDYSAPILFIVLPLLFMFYSTFSRLFDKGYRINVEDYRMMCFVIRFNKWSENSFQYDERPTKEEHEEYLAHKKRAEDYYTRLPKDIQNFIGNDRIMPHKFNIIGRGQ